MWLCGQVSVDVHELKDGSGLKDTLKRHHGKWSLDRFKAKQTAERTIHNSPVVQKRRDKQIPRLNPSIVSFSVTRAQGSYTGQ